MRWGMVGFEAEERVRPQFIGEKSRSPVNGREELFFPRNEATRRIVSSQVVILGLILVVVAAVASIFVLKYYATYVWDGAAWGSIVASVLNAVQIQVMNELYGGMAVKLNDFENHRTDTAYEDNLIAKTFVFQFVNSYASMFYIAFVKKWTQDKCIGGCMVELSTQLGSIFITRIAVGNLTEVGVPYLKAMLRLRAETQGVAASGASKAALTRAACEVEREFLSEEYDVLLGPFADYCEMMLQFGYATLFVAAYPLAMLLSFVNNYIEIRVDGWKLCQLARRPEPRSAEDIGTWYTILEVMSTICVMTNVALIVFTGNQFAWASSWGRVWAFLLIEHAILGVKYVIAVLIPDVSPDVEIQIQRADYINDKVVNNMADEDDSELAAATGSLLLDLTVKTTDDDPM